MHDLNVLALIKGNERFVYVYDDGSRDAVIDALRDQAADPDVTLNWFDAAVLTERAPPGDPERGAKAFADLTEPDTI